nr:MAG TPA: hypothetical protein [Caudoviricetes sp.]
MQESNLQTKRKRKKRWFSTKGMRKAPVSDKRLIFIFLC